MAGTAARGGDVARDLLRASLDALGGRLSWAVAALWVVDDEVGAIRCVETWARAGAAAEPFLAATRGRALPRSSGLPGHVWATGEPVWVADVVTATDPVVVRAAEARAIGLRSAVAFPVRGHGTVLGVVELFAAERHEPDPALLASLDELGAELGPALERRRLEQVGHIRVGALLEAALDAVISLDAHGHVVAWSAVAEQTFGFLAEEAIGREFAGLVIPAALRERHREGLARYVATGQSSGVLGQRLEMPARHRDGSELVVELTAVALGGREDGFVASLRDITGRKRLEAQLRDQARLLEAQGEALRDGLAAVSPSGRILSYNRAFAEIWGLPDDVLTRADDSAALRHAAAQVADPEGFLARVAELYRHPELTARDELRLRDGRVLDRWAAPLAHGGDEPPAGRVWVFRDVTEDRRREERQRFLSQAGVVLAGGLGREATLARIAALAVPHLADWCIVYLAEEDGTIRRVSIARPEDADPATVGAIGASDALVADAPAGVPQVIRSREAVLVPEVDAGLLAADAPDPFAQEALLHTLGLRSWLCVPLVARGTTLGALSLVTAASGRVFGPDDLAFAEEVAHRAALALDNARLYEQQHATAEALQRSLLPTELPALPGVQLAARYVPASPGAQVGGDWYDAVALESAHVALGIGDVAGHGIRAAATMGQLRNAMRAYTLDGHQPAEVLARVNRFSLTTAGTEIATAICLAYDRMHGAVRFAAAGHPPPLVLGADGTARFLTTIPGPPLGIEGGACPETEASLERGATVVLYTDGLVERRGESIDAGLARLARAAAGARPDPETLLDHLLDRLLAGAERPDDVALVALRALP